MTDYGRVVQFGVFPEPVAARLDEILALVGIADREGLDLVGIQDHPYQRRYLDTWMLMATLWLGPGGSRSSRMWRTCRCAPLR